MIKELMDLNHQTPSRLVKNAISRTNAGSQYQDLLDQCFKLPPASHFLQDFPVWQPDLDVSGRHQIGIFHLNGQGSGDLLVSSASARLVEVQLQDGSIIRGAVIGGVATRPGWEGKSLASQCVSDVLEWARKQQAQIAFLWGSEHSLYQRLGFDLWGQQIRIPLKGNLPAAYSSGTNVHRGWTPHLYSCLQSRPFGFVLKPEDRTWFQAHSHVEWFFSGTHDKPTAYAALGRGIDLHHLVHEWGGEPHDLYRVLQEVQRLDPQAEILGPVGPLKALGFSVDKEKTEYLCLAKELSGKIDPKSVWIWGLDSA
jgi:GNAT superfamily N-acetyltransferase